MVKKSNNTIKISALRKNVGEKVFLNGWVYNKRSVGKVWFIIIRDGTGYTQGVVVKENVSDKVFSLEQAITIESSISVCGIVKKDSRSIGGFELEITNIEIIQIADDYPISKKDHGTAFLMDNRHLWIRSKKQNAILKIRSELIKAIRYYFDSNGFVNIDTPIFTSNSCEGTTTLFKTDYFGQDAYLSQSGQLYNEANVMSFGKVYCFGPTFRAEKSKTRRHLTEFWMVEPEIAFCDLNENMEWAEGLIYEMVKWVLKFCQDQLIILNRDTKPLEMIKPPFPRISYDEAIRIINKEEEKIKWGDDFSSGNETIITNFFNSPVIVHRFPSSIKAFYMKKDPKNKRLALGMDILAPEGYGEIIGGGEREEDYDELRKQLLNNKLSEDDFQWYLDLRKYGSIPHSGFGLGLERAISWICGLSHLRESIPFPRMIYRLEP
ncbi:MAG: asparagine--tRNA ligase [Candidatus Marinimicrobia bacterium]|nr:asparagine--tRNA ligase [Candidatus Neomarinimicrobiota bacterium]|tara:strand:+ start:417 stop:1724 length:1308 start_codon:yes stop_codon:yes gene_type:complete